MSADINHSDFSSPYGSVFLRAAFDDVGFTVAVRRENVVIVIGKQDLSRYGAESALIAFAEAIDAFCPPFHFVIFCREDFFPVRINKSEFVSFAYLGSAVKEREARSY